MTNHEPVYGVHFYTPSGKYHKLVVSTVSLLEDFRSGTILQEGLDPVKDWRLYDRRDENTPLDSSKRLHEYAAINPFINNFDIEIIMKEFGT